MPRSAGAVNAFNRGQVLKAKWNLKTLGRAIDGALEGFADEIGGDVAKTVTALSSVPVFPRSAPGAPPHRETGQLTDLPPSPAATRRRRPGPAGWQHDVRRYARGRVARVWSAVPHAKWVEFGTRKMAARPALRPTVRMLTVGMSARVGARILAAEGQARARMR